MTGPPQGSSGHWHGSVSSPGWGFSFSEQVLHECHRHPKCFWNSSQNILQPQPEAPKDNQPQVFQKPSCLIPRLSHMCWNGCSGSESILGRSVSSRMASSRARLEQACQIRLVPPHTLSLIHTSLQASLGRPSVRWPACGLALRCWHHTDCSPGPGRTS